MGEMQPIRLVTGSGADVVALRATCKQSLQVAGVVCIKRKEAPTA